jgi:hypothetical protein
LTTITFSSFQVLQSLPDYDVDAENEIVKRNIVAELVPLPPLDKVG